MSSDPVVIIDYGVGNLFSLQRAVERVGFRAIISGDPQQLSDAQTLILPGVGAFGDAVKKLENLGMIQAIKDYAISGRPLLGICLGMQLLMTDSEEFGYHPGLDLIPGSVKRFPDPQEGMPHYKIPNVSWCPIEDPAGEIKFKSPILENILPGEEMYFVHSFYAAPKLNEHAAAVVRYAGIRYAGIVQKDSVYGTQFHPEKSGRAGLRLLENFLNLKTLNKERYF